MKRITIFFGHYGSGKTNVAINYAIYLKQKKQNVTIADIDIVNPYFRTKDSENELTEMGIKVISLPYANTNVDLPALPPEVYGLVQNRESLAVMDVGGDDRGAYALGRYTPYILQENDYEALFVANFYRPLTRNADEAFDVLNEIQNACGIKMTGIINNSNIGEETSESDILKSIDEAEKLSEIAEIPIVFTCAEKSIAEKSSRCFFPLTLQKKKF